MRKILIIGAGGAGKTTLARTLAGCLDLPLIHLDQLFWRPGWVATPNAEWDEMIGELVARDAWVMDGNYGRTLDVRLDAADTIIFLDLPRVVCTWRIFKRTWQHRGRVRPDVAPGCPEHLTWGFVWWVWTYRSRRRPAILERLATHSREKTVIIMRSAGEVERFIARLAPPMSR